MTPPEPTRPALALIALSSDFECTFKDMKETRCNQCGGERFESRRIEYLYRHKGKYLLVPNTPVEVCLTCGMIYYDATVLKAIEQRFFAIQNHAEEPDRYITMPEMAYS